MRFLSIVLLLVFLDTHCVQHLRALNARLFKAVASGEKREVSALLTQGAWVNAVRESSRFQTPLYVAMLLGYEEIAKILLQAGAARSVMIQGEERAIEPARSCLAIEDVARMHALFKEFQGPALPLDRSLLPALEESGE